jgi:hypothetical protein
MGFCVDDVSPSAFMSLRRIASLLGAGQRQVTPGDVALRKRANLFACSHTLASKKKQFRHDEAASNGPGTH